MPYCEHCQNEGMYIEEETARFCSCPAGHEAKKNWEAYNERVKAEAMRYRRKKRHMIKNYRTAVAGEKENGNEVPF